MIGYIWARQSNKYDKAVYSLESQIDACREAAAKDSVPVTSDREYVVKFSGVDLWKIPELTELRQVIERTPGQKRIYCYAQDRLVRGEEGPEIFWLVYELKRYGAEVKIILDPVDMSDFAGQIITLFRGHKAAKEPGDIKDRTMRGKLKRVQQGKIWNHGLEKFGYTRLKDEGRAVFNLEEKAILEDIIARIFAGESARAIANWLNCQNIAPPARRRGRIIKGKPTEGIWRHGTITSILRDPALKGEGAAMRYKNGAVRGGAPKSGWITIPEAYPALLSPERWDELQIKLSEVASKTSRTRNYRLPLIFRGRVVCTRCGRPMNVISNPYRVQGGAIRQTRAFACKHLDKAGHLPCRPYRQITIRHVESAGWEAVVEAFQPDALEALALEIEASPREDQHSGRRKALEAARLKKETQQQNLLSRLAEASAFAAKAILQKVEDVGKEIEDLNKQIAHLEREISASYQQARQMEEALRGFARFASRLDEMDFAEKRKFIEDLGVTLLWNPDERSLTLHSPIFSASVISDTA